MRILASAFILIVVGACSPNLHRAEIAEFSKSVGNLQTTLSTLRGQAFDATVHFRSQELLKNTNLPIELLIGCSEHKPDKCGLVDVSDAINPAKFPPDKIGGKAVDIVNSIVAYDKSIAALAGADDAKQISKAIRKTKDALKVVIDVIKDTAGAAALGRGLDALKASPGIFSELAGFYVDQKRREALKISVAAANPVIGKAGDVLKAAMPTFNKKIISHLESQIENGVTYLDRDMCGDAAKRDEDRCKASTAERLATMKILSDISLQIRQAARIGTVTRVKKMLEAHAALAKAFETGD